MSRKRESVVEYITRLQGMMHLEYWDIEVAEDAAEPGNYANVSTITGRCCAIISLCVGWGSLSHEEERLYLVHELLHIHQAMVTPFVAIDVREHLAPAVWEAINAGFNRQMEYMTDSLSNAVAPHLPLRLR